MVVNKSKQQYWNHQQRAKRKKIPFELTFEQWYDTWIKSGHYHEKGTKRGQYVMSRYKDQGGYTIDNVYIQTVGDNTKEAFTTNNKNFISPRFGKDNHFYGCKHSEETKQKIRDARAKRIKCVWTPDARKKASEAMKKARAIAGTTWGNKELRDENNRRKIK